MNVDLKTLIGLEKAVVVRKPSIFIVNLEKHLYEIKTGTKR